MAIVGRLISGIRQKGPGALVDLADIAQRESFDVIGKVCAFSHGPVCPSYCQQAVHEFSTGQLDWHAPVLVRGQHLGGPDSKPAVPCRWGSARTFRPAGILKIA